MIGVRAPPSGSRGIKGFLSRHAWGIVWASSRWESSFSMAPHGAWLVRVRWCRVRQTRTAVRARTVYPAGVVVVDRCASGSHTCRCLLKSRPEPRIDLIRVSTRASLHVLLDIKNPWISLLHRTPLDGSANYQCYQAS
jgi:hypothetical protein